MPEPLVRIEGYGWCIGKLINVNTNRRLRFNGKTPNFIAKFEIDEGTTDLVLLAEDYDVSADAEYEAWMLLEPEEAEAAGPP